ncbi:MAG: GTP-binding protein [Candidatus Thorarchaeota archaeon]|nr:MAG: GTP-binding protein [Candidatus Thorarchaeota archaeon]
MIYNTVLMNTASRKMIATSDYWTHKVSKSQLSKYLNTLLEMIERAERLKYKPAIIDDFKFYSRECGDDTLIIFVMDLNEPDDEAISKINRAARVLKGVLEKESTKYIKSNFSRIVDPYVVARYVIALVGESGVGKTSLLSLLMGREPPEEHIPTIALNTEVIENIRFANYEIMIIDFAGQESSRNLWDFSSTDMVFLLTDSTLKNLIASKGIMSKIEKENPGLPIIIFANKQDLPNALDPSAISKIMGVDTRSMVAVDLAYRNNLLNTLVFVLCKHFNLEVPDIFPDDLLRFVPE